VRANFGVAFMLASIARAAGLPHARTTDCPIVRDVKLLTAMERTSAPAQQVVMDALLVHA
jgi:hypothetical protein